MSPSNRLNVERSAPRRGAVFLSYAHEDSDAARQMAEALRGEGIEVWFDESALRGGDAWDASIRRQVRDCALFVPIISARTQARKEGYFRLEWKLADERSHLIAEGEPFVLPVVADGTKERDALVPKSFLNVQWTWLPHGDVPPAFVARVRRVLDGSEIHEETGRPLPVRYERGAGASPNTRRRNPAWAWSATVIMVLAAAGTVWWSTRPETSGTPGISQHGQDARATSSSAAKPPLDLASAALSAVGSAKVEGLAKADAKSIAVLPFANLSAEKDNEYFSDGLSENILDKLARNPALRVMARTSSFYYKGKNLPITQIARELNVGSVIEGSVQRAGQRLRITAQLINGSDGTHMWSQTFDHELTTANLFAVQDEIALKIASRLTPNSGKLVTEERPTANLAAYDAYLRGLDKARNLAAVEFPQALWHLEEAVRLDPGFDLAWAKMAYVLAISHGLDSLKAGDELARAQRALATAIRLRPDTAEVYVARSAILRADGVNLAEADRELVRANRLHPGNADIYLERSYVARFAGRLNDALELCRHVEERDPLNGVVHNNAGHLLTALGRYAEAAAAYERASSLMGGLNYPRQNKANLLVSANGDLRAAAREYAEIGARNFRSLENRAMLLAAAGDYAEALAVIEQIKSPASLVRSSYLVLTAQIRERMGDGARAARDYNEAVQLAQQFRDEHPDSWGAYPTLASALAGVGRKEEALAAARHALKLVPPTENPWRAAHELLAVLVEVQARFGMTDEALAIVREQIAAGWWRRNSLLLRWQFFEIRKDPRFRAIAEKAPL